MGRQVAAGAWPPRRNSKSSHPSAIISGVDLTAAVKLTLPMSPLVADWIGSGSPTSYERAITALRGTPDLRRLREEWITEWMATTPEPLRSWLVDKLAKGAGLDPEGLTLVSGHDPYWRRDNEHRAPDLLLVDIDEDIRLVIEVKAWAKVNWEWGYCPKRSDLRCCQPVCYAHGCWTKRGDLSDAKCLLVAPEKRRPHFLKARDQAAEEHGIAIANLPWEFLDLRLLFEEAGTVAKSTEEPEIAVQAATFHHLVSWWYWADALTGVPLVTV